MLHTPSYTHTHWAWELLIITLGTHAQRELVCLCRRRLFWHYRLRGGLFAIPAASELREAENQKGDFPETTAFER